MKRDKSIVDGVGDHYAEIEFHFSWDHRDFYDKRKLHLGHHCLNCPKILLFNYLSIPAKSSTSFIQIYGFLLTY